MKIIIKILMNCWICNEKINKDKVRNHCHITGKYRGAPHTKFKIKNTLKITYYFS